MPVRAGNHHAAVQERVRPPRRTSWSPNATGRRATPPCGVSRVHRHGDRHAVHAHQCTRCNAAGHVLTRRRHGGCVRSADVQGVFQGQDHGILSGGAQVVGGLPGGCRFKPQGRVGRRFVGEACGTPAGLKALFLVPCGWHENEGLQSEERVAGGASVALGHTRTWNRVLMLSTCRSSGCGFQVDADSHACVGCGLVAPGRWRLRLAGWDLAPAAFGVLTGVLFGGVLQVVGAWAGIDGLAQLLDGLGDRLPVFDQLLEPLLFTWSMIATLGFFVFAWGVMAEGDPFDSRMEAGLALAILFGLWFGLFVLVVVSLTGTWIAPMALAGGGLGVLAALVFYAQDRPLRLRSLDTSEKRISRRLAELAQTQGRIHATLTAIPAHRRPEDQTRLRGVLTASQSQNDRLVAQYETKRSEIALLRLKNLLDAEGLRWLTLTEHDARERVLADLARRDAQCCEARPAALRVASGRGSLKPPRLDSQEEWIRHLIHGLKPAHKVEYQARVRSLQSELLARQALDLAGSAQPIEHASAVSAEGYGHAGVGSALYAAELTEFMSAFSALEDEHRRILQQQQAVGEVERLARA